MVELGKCGEDLHGFYDSRGWYFREGVDPRNCFGRLVSEHIKTAEHKQRMDDIERQMLKIMSDKLGLDQEKTL